MFHIKSIDIARLLIRDGQMDSDLGFGFSDPVSGLGSLNSDPSFEYRHRHIYSTIAYFDK